ncbi:MAG: rRNA maturation RNase YbeY [Gammaproteobacteria bacterium]|nr:rRNA maturation RNase YbeY [Gammaproteobacteria bacterium]
MEAIVDLQMIVEDSQCPDQNQCENIVLETLKIADVSETKECTIRVVDRTESAELNEQYREKQGATNVLSFPFDAPIEIDIDLLGDLVICAPLVSEEAKQQSKTIEMHWNHLIVHGCLHLLGYDHIKDEDADKMESFERQVMNKLGYPDPYKMIDAS